MRRFTGVFFWGVVVLCAGATNFIVKHTVQSLDDQLASARRKTVAEQKQIHDLTAEWTYLNQPELLSDLNRRYIGLVPVSPKQIQRNLDEIPLRPAPPPEETPIEPQTVAATPPAPAAPIPSVPPAEPPSPIVPVAATTVARVTTAPASAAPARAPSLDALFAQVAGGR